MSYELLASPQAQKELDALPRRIQDGLRLVLRSLAEDPRDARFDVQPLKPRRGEPPYLRLRVGEYRVLLQIDPKAREVRIARLGHRKGIYRGLPKSYD